MTDYSKIIKTIDPTGTGRRTGVIKTPATKTSSSNKSSSSGSSGGKRRKTSSGGNVSSTGSQTDNTKQIIETVDPTGTGRRTGIIKKTKDETRGESFSYTGPTIVLTGGGQYQVREQIDGPKGGIQAIPEKGYKEPEMVTTTVDIPKIIQFATPGHIVPRTMDVEIPRGIIVAGAKEEYINVGFRKGLGINAIKQEQLLYNKLYSSKEYVSSYAQFRTKTEGLVSWQELKQIDPALYLKQQPSGIWLPEYDYLRFQQEQYTLLGKKAGSAAQFGKVFGASVLKGFADPGFWGEQIFKGEGARYIAEKEYGMQKRLWSGDISGYLVHDVVLSPPMTNIVYPLAGAEVVGAGIGAFKATSIGSKTLFHVGKHAITTGKIVEGGIAGYGTYETGKAAIEDPYGTLGHVAISLPFAALGYTSGHRFGYGRTEAYLYGKHTYKPGSAEYIRFKETLKISRKFQWVKSSDIKPLDLTKDIMRLKPYQAKQVISFLKTQPSSVIGGSASAYAQTRTNIWYKYRDIKPRDIDLLVKDVSGAKQTINAGSHVVDIHSFEFGGKAGRYFRFGFETQNPIKINGNKYMRLGEQLFRKGITSVIKEKKYRWFKDIPDFQMTSEQLMFSAKQSKNPLNWLKAKYITKHLGYIIQPETHPSYGKPDTIFGRFVTKYIKPISQPKSVITSGGYIDYIYPKSTYPTSIASIANINYYKPSIIKPSNYPILIYPIEKTTIPIKPPYTPYIPSKTITTIPPYKPVEKPPYTPPSYPPTIPTQPPPYIPSKTITTIPPYKPVEKPPYTPPSYPPTIPPTEKEYIYLDIDKKTKKKKFKPINLDKKYRVRKWKTPRVEDLLPGYKKNMKKWM